MTPLIRAAHQLGLKVDVLLATDYSETAQLLEGAPEIRRLFFLPSRLCANTSSRLDGFAKEQYDIATFTPWSAELRKRVHARRLVEVDRARWLSEGYGQAVEQLARGLGWKGEMPPPFAMAPTRNFALAPCTVAIHPGCNRVSPWKRWHGFDELAQRFPNVALVGTEEDLQTCNTYFRRPFVWPDHAQNFIGKLSLPDTAALLRQCAALVSNDSGIMQLGVALGVPTFGIFGITSPEREAMPATPFFPITKGLPCEAECRRGAWGRRDCERHLECLKTLSAEEVFMKVNTILPITPSHPVTPAKATISSPPEPVQGRSRNSEEPGQQLSTPKLKHADRRPRQPLV